jgi:hypothetical protein
LPYVLKENNLHNPRPFGIINPVMKLPEEARKMFARWGKVGGKATTREKKAAARENGKLGGRPRKKAK